MSIPIVESKPTGRPTKCTPELTQQIADIVGRGNYIEVACEACGIARKQYYAWLERAEPYDDVPLEDVPEAERVFVAFRNTIKKAYAEAEIKLFDNLVGKDFFPTAWKLERTRAQRYGLKQQIDVTERRTISVIEIAPVSRIVEGEYKLIEGPHDA